MKKPTPDFTLDGNQKRGGVAAALNMTPIKGEKREGGNMPSESTSVQMWDRNANNVSHTTDEQQNHAPQQKEKIAKKEEDVRMKYDADFPTLGGGGGGGGGGDKKKNRKKK
jgi:hypothetical protein